MKFSVSGETESCGVEFSDGQRDGHINTTGCTGRDRHIAREDARRQTGDIDRNQHRSRRCMLADAPAESQFPAVLELRTP